MNGEEPIFIEALGKATPAEQDAFLDLACAGDPHLRARVEALLAAHAQPGGILDSSVTALASLDTDPPAAATDATGSTIGPYKLLERIGEGGMGVVYMAEQLTPVHRRVALKVIKPGLDTRQVIARFEAERQALAMMDHPSIARIFDAGATDAGLPFFVMELVRGVPITDYCDQHHLTPRQRLELFIPVCQAVQHAHQKGVIHRDLKPSNVLVTLGDDGKPTPKVIDFGIAKATAGQPLTDRTLFTEFRQFLGTPLYMAPEQVEPAATDVDTRADVYGLGVLLYELLTGATPFDRQRLAKAAHDEVRRILRDEDPPRPSTRLSTMGDTLSTVTTRRGTDPKHLSQLLHGDLDWVIMKALEKDRARRYETASGFARDVERYLADQPVEACPPSRRYRFRKFARRNKSALLTAVAVTLILSIATALSSWEAVRAHRAAAAAIKERDRADRAANTAARVADYLQEAYSTAANSPGGKDQVVHNVLDKLGEQVNQGLENEPEVEAALHLSLAQTYFWHYGDREKAERHAARAVELYRRTRGEHDARFADSLTMHAYVLVRFQRGAADQALAEARQGVAIFRELGIRDGQFIFALRSLTSQLAGARRNSEVGPLDDELLAIFRADPTRQVDADEFCARAAVARHDLPTAEQFYWRAYRAPAKNERANVIALNFATVLTAERKFPQALEVRLSAIAGFRQELPADSQAIGRALITLTNDLRCARHYRSLAGLPRPTETLATIDSIYRASLTIGPLPQYRNNPRIAAVRGLAAMVNVYAALADELARAGKPRQADAFRAKSNDLLADVAGLYQSLLDELAPRVSRADIDLAAFRVEYAGVLIRLGRSEEASAIGDDVSRQFTDFRALNRMAWTTVVDGDRAPRLPALGVALARRAVGSSPNERTARSTLGAALYRAGDYPGALDALDPSHHSQPAADFGWEAFFLAMSQWQLGHWDDARASFALGVSGVETKAPPDLELLAVRAEAEALMHPIPPATAPAATKTTLPTPKE